MDVPAWLSPSACSNAGNGTLTPVGRHLCVLLHGAPAGTVSGLSLLLLNAGVQFVFSWMAFSMYIWWDYSHYRAGDLERAKLPSRHPLDPFWYSQLRMVPLVVYNQLVVWPLVMVLLIWPTWVVNERPWGSLSWWNLLLLPALMLVSDQMWYWSHRFMHTPYAWKHWHRMHHIAEQTAISATYVHPVEYAMFTFAMNFPFALAGFPAWVHAIPMAWGMFTGSGAHSGYSGAVANGDKHNAHHYYHNVNFGLLMVADAIFGTHWSPGDPPPRVWSEAITIWKAFPSIHGTEDASTFLDDKGCSKEQNGTAAGQRAGADGDVAAEDPETVKLLEAMQTHHAKRKQA